MRLDRSWSRKTNVKGQICFYRGVETKYLLIVAYIFVILVERLVISNTLN